MYLHYRFRRICFKNISSKWPVSTWAVNVSSRKSISVKKKNYKYVAERAFNVMYLIVAARVLTEGFSVSLGIVSGSGDFGCGATTGGTTGAWTGFSGNIC